MEIKVTNNTAIIYSSVRKKDDFFSSKFYIDDFKILESSGLNVFFSNTILDFLNYKNYDKVLIYFYTKGFFVGLISKFFGKSVFYTGGIDYVDESKFLTIHNIFFVLCYGVSNNIFIVSKSDLNRAYNVLKRYKICGKKLIYNPHYINLRDVKDLKENRNFFKANNISSDDILLTTICWRGVRENVYRKGLDLCLYVLKELIIFNPHYKLIIIGDGGKGDLIINELIIDLKLSKNVIITGRIDDDTKYFLLSKSKYYLQFSRYEGFGLAVLEAIAFNCLVVHSNRGGLSETISNRGLIIDISDSPISIANKIVNFSFDNSLLLKAKEFILSEYSFDQRSNVFNKYL